MLGGQVAERQLQAWEADQQQEKEEEAARQAEQLTDALLQQEAKRMAERGYRPQVRSLQGMGLGPAPPGLCEAFAQPCFPTKLGFFLAFLPFLTSRGP